jgi:hypothetical protein
MIMRERELQPETVGDLKAALADAPDDMEILDVFQDFILLTVRQDSGGKDYIEFS